jgi:mRNA interferase HigB
MRIVTRQFIEAAAKANPCAAQALGDWLAFAAKAAWTNPVEMKNAAPSVDPVKVKSGRTVYVCNIRRNEYRLVIAVHFNHQRIYTLCFMTHAEYDRRNWKDEL